jgi:hypothetical protein
MVEATDTGQPAPHATKLKRTVGVLLLFFFIVGDTLGAGIYTLIGTMAADVGRHAVAAAGARAGARAADGGHLRGDDHQVPARRWGVPLRATRLRQARTRPS